MSPDVERFIDLPQLGRKVVPSEAYPTQHDPLGGGVRRKIDSMASHMLQQLKEHEAAQKRTNVMFEQLLCQLEETVVTFQQSFLNREMPIGNVYATIDSDRSLGILNLLWHTVSFSCRNNTKPMALNRNGRMPLFSGRIVAMMGDYHDTVLMMHSQEYPDLLETELASLYIPAAPDQPAVMKFQHRKEEFFFHQAEATQQFLVKILEALCNGGYFHESLGE